MPLQNLAEMNSNYISKVVTPKEQDITLNNHQMSRYNTASKMQDEANRNFIEGFDENSYMDISLKNNRKRSMDFMRKDSMDSTILEVYL